MAKTITHLKAEKTARGFPWIEHPAYVPPHDPKRLVSASSAVGDYEDAYDRPGSSFLWIGEHHHLNREQVAELVEHLTAWLETGEFKA